MTTPTTITSPNRERNATHRTNGEDQHVTIELTGKEAFDTINALDELQERVSRGSIATTLPVSDARNMALGGMHFPNEYSILIPDQEHAAVIIWALADYQPDEADFTPRLQRDILRILNDSPLDFDIEPLRNRSSL